MSRLIQFVAYGIPQPKGSSKAFRHQATGAIIVTSDNPRLKDWQHAVASAAQAHLAGHELFDGAVVLTLQFALPRPKSLARRVVEHTKRPDLDKLARSVKDALTGVVWRDDSLVVRLTADKRYAAPDEPPHVNVTAQLRTHPAEQPRYDLLAQG